MISPSPIRTPRGFIFPFVMFIVVAGVFIVSQIYLYNATANIYDELARIENQADIGLENQATIFRRILSRTNTNGSGAGAGSDNDDYLGTGSGGVGVDDDADAFRYRFGTLLPAETRNILFVDRAYCSYSSISDVSKISTLRLAISGTGNAEIRSMDSGFQTLATKIITLTEGPNMIDVSSMVLGESLAVFLSNPRNETSLTYTLSAEGGSGAFTNFAPAVYLGGGRYRYYSNLLMEDSQKKLLLFSRTFTN